MDRKRNVLIEPPENPLDWYTLTETTNSILNELIAYTGREEVKELQKECTDEKRIAQQQELFREIHAINLNPELLRALHGRRLSSDNMH